MMVFKRHGRCYQPPMDHQGTIIRPPSEANSILLQVTLGCSHNKCDFCGAYMNKRFAIKDSETIRKDLAFAATHCKNQRRLFLMDGDALIIPQNRLLSILADIRTMLPWVNRIGTYASAKSLRLKSDEQLRELKEAGIDIVYMGLESGDDVILKAMHKNGNAQSIVEQGQRARRAGFKLNVTVINGLGGVERSMEHAQATARALSAMDPEQIGALSLMLIPGTPLHERAERGDFELPDAYGILREIRELLAGLNLSRGLFLANHASNYLPMKVRLPSGKAKALAEIDAALDGERALKPEGQRRL